MERKTAILEIAITTVTEYNTCVLFIKSLVYN